MNWPFGTYRHLSAPWRNSLKFKKSSFASYLHLLLPTNEFDGKSVGLALLLQGEHEAALAEFRKETLDDGQMEGSAMALFAMGRKSDSDAQLAKAIRRNGGTGPVVIASVYGFRGEKDLAFEWLDRAFKARDPFLIYLPGDPLQKRIEADPRFRAFLMKMNFPQ